MLVGRQATNSLSVSAFTGHLDMKVSFDLLDALFEPSHMAESACPAFRKAEKRFLAEGNPARDKLSLSSCSYQPLKLPSPLSLYKVRRWNGLG